MPTHVEHRPIKGKKDYAIVENSTGHIKGRSETRKKAEISSSKRNSAHKRR